MKIYNFSTGKTHDNNYYIWFQLLTSKNFVITKNKQIKDKFLYLKILKRFKKYKHGKLTTWIDWY